MEMRKEVMVFWVMLGLAMCFGGCGKEPEEGPPPVVTPPIDQPAVEVTVDENKSLGEIKTEVENMNVAQLRSAALKYKEATEAKLEEFNNINEQIKATAATEALKESLDRLNESIQALKDRHQIYFDTVKKLGGDVSDLEIKIL